MYFRLTSPRWPAPPYLRTNPYSVTVHKSKLSTLFTILITQVSKYLIACLFTYSVPFIVSLSIKTLHELGNLVRVAVPKDTIKGTSSFTSIYKFSNSCLPPPKKKTSVAFSNTGILYRTDTIPYVYCLNFEICLLTITINRRYAITTCSVNAHLPSNVNTECTVVNLA